MRAWNLVSAQDRLPVNRRWIGHNVPVFRGGGEVVEPSDRPGSVCKSGIGRRIGDELAIDDDIARMGPQSGEEILPRPQWL